jgi:transposase InsO family protein
LVVNNSLDRQFDVEEPDRVWVTDITYIKARESCFNPLKRERVRRRTYKIRVDARWDVFDYFVMFNNPKGKHVRNGMLSLVECERQQKMISEGV